MPQIAYYRCTHLTKDDAIQHAKTLIKDADHIIEDINPKEFAALLKLRNVTVDRLNDLKTFATANGGYDIFERVKVEVATAEAASLIASTTGFVRFAIGGHTSLSELIKRRKSEGRSDWYV